MSRSEFESEPTVDLNAKPLSSDRSSGPAEELVSILDRYLAELQAGRIPDRAAILASHPALASRLDACFAGIDFVHGVTASDAGETPARLGEFLILRELGRGGMGVVYEAEQSSLRRRVAVKVLRFGVVADPEAMKRFQREAETVARLHHTNIVPIFAVGTERGVHYYAMQYIAGRSLADVLADTQAETQLPSVPDVVRWGVQAADALAHAHQRGVIHRDIKPSNLLLDAENVVWLTDFGLAKSDDELTLTLSGALMGTPRYMSPEQAEAVCQAVDHRTDIYSLGATLYELATGRPVFDAATPHGVLAQIVHDEPKPPRQVRPSLPRDLETVILTCLSKDATKRYATAQALADDLRAVLSGTPIKARRAPWTERVARAARTHRKAAQIAAATAAASLLLVIGSLIAWRWYYDGRLGRLVLTTDVPSLTVEILGDHGDAPQSEPLAIGAKTSLALPAGDYRLKVKAPGRLSRTAHVGFYQGETLTRSVGLDEDFLLGAERIPYAFATEAVAFEPGRKADLVEWTGQTLVRRDGATGKPRWDLARPSSPWPSDRNPLAAMRRLFAHGDEQRPGWPIGRAPDLNDDGTCDVVWAFVGTPALLALSGRDGSLLWTYSAASASPESFEGSGCVTGTPVVVDADGDGAPDIIAAFATFDDANQWSSVYQGGAGKGRRVVHTVSGRTGKSLWSRTIQGEPTPFTFADMNRGVMIATGKAGPVVGIEAGTRWLPLSPSTGEPFGPPIDLGFAPLRPVQLADLDGDGSSEVLALGRGATPAGSSQNDVLVSFSTAIGKPLWTVPVRGAYRPQAVDRLLPEWPLVADLDADGRVEIVVPDWGNFATRGAYRGLAVLDGATGKLRWSQPLCPFTKYVGDDVDHLAVAPDLDGDGVRDVVAVSRFHGRHPFSLYSDRPQEPVRVYVDAISGQAGKRLWEWHHDLEGQDAALVWPPRWWGRGADGGPLLAIAVGGNLPDRSSQKNPKMLGEQPEVFMLAAASGRSVHSVEGLSWIRADDLDGDGVEDLWGMADGALRAFRGGAPEAWRALGSWTPAGDLDRDDVADFVTGNLVAPPVRDNNYDVSSESRTMAARSGRDGRILWRAVLDYASDVAQKAYRSYVLHPFPDGGDFDGDGAPDVVVRFDSAHRAPAEQLRMELRSGHTGQRLWTAGLLATPSTKLPPGYENAFAKGSPNTDTHDVFPCDVNHSGRPDLVLRRTVAFLVKPIGTTLSPAAPIASVRQTRFTRLSGRDGTVVYDEPVDQFLHLASNADSTWSLGDLDGDGAVDCVCTLFTDMKAGRSEFSVYGISLRDGKRMWSRPLHGNVGGDGTRIAVGDLDGDGCAEVVLIEPSSNDAKAPITICALEGRDGAERWTWRGGGELDRANEARTTGFALVAFQGKKASTVCVNVGIAGTSNQRLILLDARGGEVARKELGGASSAIDRGDYVGDGCERILVHEGGRLRCLGAELDERWSRPEAFVRQVLSGRRGKPGTVVINPVEGLDGATGQPRWSAPGNASIVFDPGGDHEPARLMSVGSHEVVCRLAVPTDRSGIAAPPRVVANAASASPGADPRWRRPLPWTREGSYRGQPLLFVVVATLALFNLVVPVTLLRRATRQRFWGMPLVLTLPVAAAVPLTVWIVIRTTLPVARDGNIAGLQLVAAVLLSSIAGLPLMVYLQRGMTSIYRRRWAKLGSLLGTTLLATVVMGVYLIRRDERVMPPIESFDRSEWYELGPWGMYAVGIVLMLVQMCGAARRLALDLQRRWAETAP